jgi:hypothetical protein
MTKTITQLPPEQEALIPVYREANGCCNGGIFDNNESN